MLAVTAGLIASLAGIAWLGGFPDISRDDASPKRISSPSGTPAASKTAAASPRLTPDTASRTDTRTSRKPGTTGNAERSGRASARDWMDETDPYLFYDDETLHALIRAGDGKAAELLSMRLFGTDPEQAVYQVIVAAALDGNGDALTNFVDLHLSTHEQVLDALPLMLVAQDLGHPYAKEWVSIHFDEGRVDEEQLQEAKARADEIFTLMNTIRREALAADPLVRDLATP